MHQFLASVGFKRIKKKEDINFLLNEVINNPTNHVKWTREDGTVYAEFSKDYAEYMGIAVRGEYGEDGVFQIEYFFPYFCGSGYTTHEHVDIEKHSDKEAYAGVCDETRIGIALIFYLQNVIEYLKEYGFGKYRGNMKTTLSGLSKTGMILLPVHTCEKKDKVAKGNSERLSLLEAARSGDEAAIESLTLEDIDTYSMIAKRINNEDVLSIVNTYFMPYGIESDQYAVLGVIEDYHYTRNIETKEDICILTINCNNMIFDVCINTEDLVGAPQVGRRFKGVIWMQGCVYHG